MNTLAVIPTFLRSERDLSLTLQTVETIKKTSNADVLVVDDCSPGIEFVNELRMRLRQGEMIVRPHNSGFAASVNIGLGRARHSGRDAVLVNADMEFRWEGWLEALENAPGGVVGGKLLFPQMLIQHAGIYYSPLHRTFENIFRFAPADLPESNLPRACPVTGALQYIRHTVLDVVGLYDERFKMGYEDIDYCMRAMEAGFAVRYEPTSRAVHHEQTFRGKPTEEQATWWDRSWRHFHEKHAGKDIRDYMPTMGNIRERVVDE